MTEEFSEDLSVKQNRKTVLDFFIADISNAEVEITDELFSRMIEHAKSFLISGGLMSWERWALLGPISREAFQEAAIQIKVRSLLQNQA